MSALSAIVLAAGQGTRMKSSVPKPAHRLCGRPMVAWVLRALEASDVSQIAVVVGHGAEQVTSAALEADLGVALSFVEQRSQRGTGDAASVGLTGLAEDVTELADVIVLPGDTPMLTAETIASFVDYHRSQNSVCTIMTAIFADPTGYGRVLRNAHGSVERVVEQRDATPEELAITEVNTGIYCFRQSLLAPALRRITPNNAQGEFYLTDVVGVLRSTGYAVHAQSVADALETGGVNDRAQLIGAEVHLRERVNRAWMREGVSIIDPAGTVIDASVALGVDITIHPGSALTGDTAVGDGATIGPHTALASCSVGSCATVVQTVAQDAAVGADARVGPFVVLEPGSKVIAGGIVKPFTTVTS